MVDNITAKRQKELNNTMNQTSKPKFSLHHGDVIECLKLLDSESIDLALTDPPYESLEKYRSIGTTTRLKNSKASSNAWFDIFPDTGFPELFEQFYRIMKKNTHLYVFSNQESMFVIKPIAEAAGFKFWKPIVWDKQKIGMGYHYRARYEFVLFFEKGKRKLTNLGTPDVLQVPRVFNGYPTEKPVALNEIFIEQSSLPGEVILDPFMGSSSAGEAALNLNRNFIGNDLCLEAVEVAKERLSGAGGVETSEKLSKGKQNVQHELQL